MTILKKTLILFVIFGASPSFAQEGEPFHAVENLFAAISAYDYDAMYASATADFQLLEDGEVWDMTQLVEAVREAEGQIARRNYFAIIREVEKDGTVWISYWNRADLQTTEDEGSVAWLESVVVVREDGQWKLEMMHSTSLGGIEHLPDGLEMEEYVGANPFFISD